MLEVYQVCGLCGNYDYQMDNELELPTGEKLHDFNQFAKYYEDSDMPAWKYSAITTQPPFVKEDLSWSANFDDIFQ